MSDSENKPIYLKGPILGKEKPNSMKRPTITNVGTFVNIIWIISIFISPPIEANIFLGIGIISLLLTIYMRFNTRFYYITEFSEIQGGGSIAGFVLASMIGLFFYDNRFSTITVLDSNPSIEFILQIFIVFAFLVWFAVPVNQESQDILFGLPPSISYLILNFWKLLILIKFITYFNLIFNLGEFDPLVNAILLTFAYFELILLIFRQKTINIIDIILDIQQIFIEIFRGPGQALKWSFFIIFFILIGMLPQDAWMLSVVAFSFIVGIATFSNMINKVGRHSGIFSSKLDSQLEKTIESGKTLVPSLLDEINHIEPSDLHENFYSPESNFSIKKKNKIINFHKHHMLFRVPLRNNLEDNLGIYVATMFPGSGSKTKSRGRNNKKGKRGKGIWSDIKEDIIEDIKKDEPSIGQQIEETLENIMIKSIRKFSAEEWEKIRSNSIPIPTEEVVTKLGFKNKEEFDQRIRSGLVGIIEVQDQVRSRYRGLPAISDKDNIITKSWSGEQHIEIPENILKEMKEKNIDQLEIIPGKDEYLFYVRLR